LNKSKIFFFKQAKMQYIISMRVIHLVQGVQKEKHPKVITRQLQISHNRVARKCKEKTDTNYSIRPIQDIT